MLIKLIINLNVKCTNVKLLEQNTGEKLVCFFQ